MAKKGRSAPKLGDTTLDMTPVIDIVFNLVIFFMVVTDMSQQDLEFLILPKANEATEDKGEDKERLIINIINFDSPENKERVERKEIDSKLPPVFIDGRQVPSLDYLRKWLRLRADPVRYPDKEKGEVAPGIYPSRKPVLVRCDQGQIFGWVQAVMQYCTFVPGRDQKTELLESPLIYKLEMAVGKPKTEGE